MSWLEVDDCQDALVVLPLRQLGHLGFEYSRMPAQQLLQLSSLQELEDISLEYRCGTAAAAAAAAWPALPVCELAVHQQSLPVLNRAQTATMIQAVSKVTQATALKLATASQPFAATPQQVADALQDLDWPGELTLHADEGDVFTVQAEDQEGLGDWQHLSLSPIFEVVGELYSQEKLDLRSDMQHSELDALAAAGGDLTELTISTPTVDGYTACTLALSLTSLRSLALGYDESTVGNGSAVVISNCLTALTQLWLRGQALQQLTKAVVIIPEGY